MVKLPDSAPDVTGKNYRFMQLSVALDGVGNGTGDIELLNSQFNSFISMTSNTAGTLDGEITEIEKAGLGGNVGIENDAVNTPLSADIAANGATTLTITDQTGRTVIEGFFNQDASVGVFTMRRVPDGGDPSELGLVVLVEVADGATNPQ